MTRWSDERRAQRLIRPLLVLLLTTVGLLAAASPAAAHLDLASSDPADGAVISDPTDGITLTFNQAATPSGDGFTVHDASGDPVPVDVDSSEGGVVWTVRPTGSLGPERYGLSWEVTAEDAHPRTGAITFEVPPSTASGDADSTSPPESGADPGSGAGSDPDGHAGMTGMPGHTAATSDAGTSGSGGGASEAALTSGGDDTSWALAAALARWASFAGVLVAVGALVVVVSTLVGSEGDVRLSQRVVRTAAGLAALGALTEGVCLLWAVGPDIAWRPATAVGLRLLGAVGLAATVRLVPQRTGGRRSHDVPALPEVPRGGQRSAQAALLVLTPPVRTGRVRGIPTRPGAAAALSTTVLVSFAFDGHTASVGSWPVTAAAALVHTAAGAVWVGGVVLLATLLLARARAGVPTGAGELAVRFSVPATAAVVLVGLTGTALTLLIIDTPAELVTTPWGRVLLIKVGLVAAVGVMGYLNNRYAVPALDAWRPGTARLLRRTVTAEATVMIVLLLTTAVLVASQT